MDFLNMLYHMIGDRVREIRSNSEISKDRMRTDGKLLSNISNGKAEKQNPNLLTFASAEEITQTYGIGYDYLVYGDDESKERIMKLVLLCILFNGLSFDNHTVNPFISFTTDDEMLSWAKFRIHSLPNDLATAISIYQKTNNNPNRKTRKDKRIRINENTSVSYQELIDHVKEQIDREYGFFFSSKNHEYFELLNDKKEDSFQNLSDMLFTQLLHDWQFTKSFTHRVCNRINNADHNDSSDNYSDKQYVPINDNIEHIITHPSDFLLTAIDYKDSEYYKFIHAVNRLYETGKEKLESYFQKTVFVSIDKERLLKDLSNEIIIKELTSSEFFEVCRTIGTIDEYTNIESIFATNYYRLRIQELYLRRTASKNNDDNLDKYSYLLSAASSHIYNWRQ